MPVEGIIFDCDGTLVDSEPLAAEAVAGYAAELGAPLSPETTAALRGRKMTECLEMIEAATGISLPDEFTGELRRRMAILFGERLRPIEGAMELVTSLRIPFCVASSGPREKIELSLSLTGLLPHFTDRIFSSYEVGIWKPDPGLFLHAAAAMGIPAERCAVVEDSLPGVLAGVAAGMTVFALGMRDDIVPDGVLRIERLLDLHDHLSGIRR